MPAEIVRDGIPFSRSATYFRTVDVRPFVDERGRIHIYNGEGDRRSWGKPKVTSTVSEIEGIVRVEVVGWHKHTVSPVGGVYWFVPNDDDGIAGWKMVNANHHLVRHLARQNRS